LNIFQSWLYVWVSIINFDIFSSKFFFSLKLDSNISEHTHLFDELHTQLSSKFNSIIVKLQNIDQYSSIHNILKTTKIELNKVENRDLIFNK
jgi:hypothetical protein